MMHRPDTKTAGKPDRNRGAGQYLPMLWLLLPALLLVSGSACQVKDIRYHHQEAVRQLSSGQERQAMNSYQEALKLDEDDFVTLYNLGVLELKQKQYKNARKHLVQAIRQNTNHAPAYYNLGLCYMGMDQLEAGYTSFDRAIHLDKTMIDCYLTAAWYKNDEGKPKEAVSLLNKAKSEETADFRVFRNLGKLNIEQNDYNAAVTNLRTAIEMGSTNWKTHALLADACIETENIVEAKSNIQIIEEIAAAELNLRLLRTKLLMHKQDSGKAEKLLLDTTEVFPDSYQAAMLIGDFYKEQKQLEKSISYFRRAANIDYKKMRPKLKMAKVYFENSQFRNAEDILLQLNKDFPNNYEILRMLSTVYGERRYYDRVIRYGKKALALDRKNKKLQAVLGIAYMQVDDKGLHDPKKAIELLWPLRKEGFPNVRTYLKRALEEAEDSRAAGFRP